MTSKTDHNPRQGSISRRSHRKLIAAASAAAVVLGAIVIFIWPYLFSGCASAAVIRIPANASAANISDSLARYFGDRYAARTMRIFNSLTSDPAERHGAYDIPKGSSPATAARILARGGETQVTLTINGVRQLLPFADRIATKFDFSGDDLRNALADPTLLGRYGLTPAQAPALFVNDTYYLYWSDSPEELIEKLGDNYLRIWDSNRRREKAAALGLTPAEIMTIASIVDEETNKISEKGKIGRLYINRLNRKMRLQADPTVRFALGDFSIRRVTGSHLNAPGPYNTYKVYGLPPGPIRTTSQATIDAILDSEPSDDLYMCAREDFSGFHNFASNYDDHMANARRYQKALDERGIK